MRQIRCCAALVLFISVGWSQAPASDEFSSQDSNPANQTAPTVSQPPAELHRPRMAGSSTGYIDNAIVGSEIRLRFDGDFDLQNPDRAEFFYAKCGCYRNGANPVDPNAPGPGPGLAKSANLQELQLHVEYAPTRRVSILVEIPARWIQFTPSPGTGDLANGAGLGDFRAGFKYALLAGENRYLTFQMRAYFPTGDSRRGLGTNHYSVEPTLLYYQRFGERLAVSSELGDWHPIGGSNGLPISSTSGFAGDILIYGLGAGYDVLRKENYVVTPVLEFVGWTILSGFVTNDTGSSTSSSTGTIVNMKMGARLSLQSHSSFYAGYGRELTHSSWYTNIVRFEYRFAF
jgi:Putative MetA-pathway of phenol degradation